MNPNIYLHRVQYTKKSRSEKVASKNVESHIAEEVLPIIPCPQSFRSHLYIFCVINSVCFRQPAVSGTTPSWKSEMYSICDHFFLIGHGAPHLPESSFYFFVSYWNRTSWHCVFCLGFFLFFLHVK